MAQNLISKPISEHPFWWEACAQYPKTVVEMPQKCDVVIVGSGYTGLSAALSLARHGCSVAVLESKQLGHGASSRNAGMVSGVLKHSPQKLRKQLGGEICERIFSEAQGSVTNLEQLIKRENISCSYERCGMYFAAYTPRDFERMAAEQDALADVGVETDMVCAADSRSELASEYYYGGRILRLAGGLHPAELHRGLAHRAVAAGVSIHENTRAFSFKKVGGRWQVNTTNGQISSENLLLATNGYIDGIVPRIAHRLIPIRSYMMATAPLGKDSVKSLIPNARMIQDTKNILYYFRPSPDGTRIIFGGRASFGDINLKESAHRLTNGLKAIFPGSKASLEPTHSWRGTVAFTFDKLPHIGAEDGMYYSAGYCGQGVAMSIYLGERAASAMLTPGKSTSVFQELSFRGKLGYNGKPWMLPAVSMGLHVRDYVNRHIHN